MQRAVWLLREPIISVHILCKSTFIIHSGPLFSPATLRRLIVSSKSWFLVSPLIVLGAQANNIAFRRSKTGSPKMYHPRAGTVIEISVLPSPNFKKVLKLLFLRRDVAGVEVERKKVWILSSRNVQNPAKNSCIKLIFIVKITWYVQCANERGFDDFNFDNLLSFNFNKNCCHIRLQDLQSLNKTESALPKEKKEKVHAWTLFTP